MDKKLGLWSLTATGIGAIIGSGWLFASYRAASAAGSGSFISWIVGASIIMLIALIISEVSTLHPKRGLFTRMLTLSHNKDMGYITALANWLGIVAVIPQEAMATVQYLSSAKPSLTNYLYFHEQLTVYGLLFVTFLVLIYVLLNFWGAQVFAKTNNTITIFKLFVPTFTALAIILYAFHPHNFVLEQNIHLEHGATTIFSAIMTSGIIISFNGFQAIASFCSEAENPGKNIPRALMISILIGLIIFLLLQTAFIGGMPPEMMEKGWANIHFPSPVVNLTAILGFNFISLLLYVDSCISPSGTGIVYTGITSRMLTAMSEERQMPKYFSKLHIIYNFSRRSLIFNMCLALSLMWFFPSWQALAPIVSLFHVVSYMACPLSLMRLRITEAHRHRLYRMPFAKVLCPLLFVLITLLFSLTPEKDLITVSGALTIFYILYVIISNGAKLPDMIATLKRSFAFVLYLIILTLLGYIGNPHEGGLDLISHTTFYILMTIGSLGFYAWMVYGIPLEKDYALPND